MKVKEFYDHIGHFIKENPEVEDKDIVVFIPVQTNQKLPLYEEYVIDFLYDSDYSIGLYCNDKLK